MYTKFIAQYVLITWFSNPINYSSKYHKPYCSYWSDVHRLSYLVVTCNLIRPFLGMRPSTPMRACAHCASHRRSASRGRCFQFFAEESNENHRYFDRPSIASHDPPKKWCLTLKIVSFECKEFVRQGPMLNPLSSCRVKITPSQRPPSGQQKVSGHLDMGKSWVKNLRSSIFSARK